MCSPSIRPRPDWLTAKWLRRRRQGHWSCQGKSICCSSILSQPKFLMLLLLTLFKWKWETWLMKKKSPFSQDSKSYLLNHLARWMFAQTFFNLMNEVESTFEFRFFSINSFPLETVCFLFFKQDIRNWIELNWAMVFACSPCLHQTCSLIRAFKIWLVKKKGKNRQSCLLADTHTQTYGILLFIQAN